MSDSSQGPAKVPLILRLFGWVFGTLSLLNLIQDLRVLELRGLIRDWLAAYASLVSSVGHFLFGWIDWQWVKIESDEYHILILSAIVGGAVGRARYATLLRKGQQGAGGAGDALGMALGVVILAMLGVLLLSTPASLWVGGVLVLFGIIGLVTKDERRKDPDISAWDFFREILIVGAIFLAIILANYMFFPPA